MNREISVWVVDDDKDCLDLLSWRLRLEMNGKPLPGFCSAEAALTALENQPAPEIILMDLQMPGMTGIDAIPLVHQRAPQTRVIIVTTFFDELSRRQALAAGAADFLRKSGSARGIVEAILRALGRPGLASGSPGRGENRHGKRRSFRDDAMDARQN